MRYMHCPEKAWSMVEAVFPVIHKIFKNGEYNPVNHRVPCNLEMVAAQMIEVAHDKPYTHKTHQGIEAEIEYGEIEIGKKTFYRIKIFMFEVAIEHLSANHQYIYRHGGP